MTIERPSPSSVETHVTLSGERPLRLERPIVTASGLLGFGAEAAELVDLRDVGLFVTRGVSLAARGGAGLPRMVEVPGGMMHAIGRENPGVDEVIDRHGAAWRAAPCAIAISLVAANLASLGMLIARLESRADLVGADAYELDLTASSDALGGRRWESSLEASTRFIDAARDSTELPLVVKVSPDAADAAGLANAAADAGADLFSMSGSPAGFLPNRARTASALAEGEGELSGPLIRPRALAAVALVATEGALPIIGGGGIGSPADALDYFAAGAQLVSLGSALWADPGLPRAVIESARRAAASRGGSRVADLVGTALRRATTR